MKSFQRKAERMNPQTIFLFGFSFLIFVKRRMRSESEVKVLNEGNLSFFISLRVWKIWILTYLLSGRRMLCRSLSLTQDKTVKSYKRKKNCFHFAQFFEVEALLKLKLTLFVQPNDKKMSHFFLYLVVERIYAACPPDFFESTQVQFSSNGKILN